MLGIFSRYGDMAGPFPADPPGTCTKAIRVVKYLSDFKKGMIRHAGASLGLSSGYVGILYRKQNKGGSK